MYFKLHKLYRLVSQYVLWHNLWFFYYSNNNVQLFLNYSSIIDPCLFSMAQFITKAMPIIINLVSVKLLLSILKMIRTHSTGHAGFIHVNVLKGGHTHLHPHMPTLVMYWPKCVYMSVHVHSQGNLYKQISFW